MRSPLLSLAIIVFIAVACQPQAASFTDADAAAVREITPRYVELTLAGDFAGLAQMFSEDAVVMPPNGEAVTGRAAIQEFLTAYPTIVEFESMATDIAGRGDLAYATGTYAITVMPEGAAEGMADSGKWMAIAEKQADGSWLITKEIWNTDLPLPE